VRVRAQALGLHGDPLRSERSYGRGSSWLGVVSCGSGSCLVNRTESSHTRTVRRPTTTS
jgi:hypothetical protein